MAPHGGPDTVRPYLPRTDNVLPSYRDWEADLRN